MSEDAKPASLPLGTRSPDGGRFWNGSTWAKVDENSPLNPSVTPMSLAVGTRSPDGIRFWNGSKWERVEGQSPSVPTASPVLRSAATPGAGFKMGRREKLIGAGVVALIALGLVGNSVLSNRAAPEAVASDYVGAVGSNNADAVWADSTLQTGTQSILSGPNPYYALASQDELKAMFGLSQNKHSGRDSIRATKLADDGAGHAAVSVAYTEGGKTNTVILNMMRNFGSKKFGLYADWRVVLAPGFLDLSGRASGTSVAVDGVGVPSDTSVVATYVGAHRVSMGASGLFAADSEIVNVMEGQSTSVAFKVNLASGAKTQAVSLLKTAFGDCAKMTTTSSQKCPQNLYAYGATNVVWTLVGDPTADLTFGIDNSGQGNGVVGNGHFLMTVVYDDPNTPGVPVHRFSVGVYQANFKVNGVSLALDDLSAGGSATDLAAPAGNNETAIKAAVLAAFEACATIKVTGGSYDCPMGVYAYNPSNVHWSVVGDPTAAAVVAWDGASGTYMVTGNFDMKVTYTDAYAGSQSGESTGAYTAHVLWTAARAQVVWIEGR